MFRWITARSNMKVILEPGKLGKFRWQLYENEDEFAGICPPRGFETEHEAYLAAKKAFGNRHPIYGSDGKIYRKK